MTLRGLLLALACLCLGATAAGAQSSRGYVPSTWGQVHYRADGPKRGPVVILLHRMFLSSVQFTAAQRLLAGKGLRTIAFDLPGYGLSDAPPAEPDADAYAQAVMTAIDAIGIRTFAVVGVDTGSTIALILANRHPDRVRALVLDGAPIFPPEEAARLIAAPHVDRTPQPDGSHFTKRWASTRAIVGPAASDAYLEMSTTQFFQAAPSYWWAHDAIFRYDFAAALRRLRVPAMLLSYPASGLHRQEAVAMAIQPALTLVPIETGGRIATDAAGPWSEAVAAFLLAHHRLR